MSKKRRKHELRMAGGGRNRKCAVCREWYFRRNKEEVWVNEFTKVVINVCLNCSKPKGGIDELSADDRPSWISKTAYDGIIADILGADLRDHKSHEGAKQKKGDGGKHKRRGVEEGINGNGGGGKRKSKKEKIAPFFAPSRT